jgi:tetratricopeptide (TPR) repeat protein
MAYSNREGMGPLGRTRRPRGQLAATALILGMVAAGLVFRTWWNGHSADQASQQTKPIDVDYKAFTAAMLAAEGIADPLQRCLHYPNLPGTHWNDATTMAYCQMRTRHTMSLADIDALLKQGKADQVDRTFQGYLDAQQHDPQQPATFDQAFYNAGFDDAKADTRKIIDEWKRQSPNSAYALAASGMQYLDAAQQARGMGWSRDLADDQVNGMREQLALARKDLNRAADLQPAATIVYRSMIYVGGLDGDDDYLEQAAIAGLKADPANYGIRIQMMNQAQPKWGEMFGGEEQQRQEDQALVGKNPLLRMVAARPGVYRATCSECDDNQTADMRALLPAADSNVSYTDLNNLAETAYDRQPRLAVEFYSESLRFNPTAPDVLRWRAELMMRLGDVKGGVQSIEEVAHHYPDNNAVALQLGEIYVKARRVKEAEQTYLAILQRDPDNEDAMAWLGDLYNHAGHQPEKAEALADTLISRNPNNPQGYIVRACNQMDHNLPGRYDTIHYFIDHFGDRPEFKSQVAEMRAYLVSHPEKIGQG